jgi:RHS repeat-associated protein
MPTTDYIVANGMMLGEITNGVMRNYGTDALGSVVSTYSNGTLENTYAYKPYGATLAKTGTAADPSFLWNGGSGYRAVPLLAVSYYVRRRHYSSAASRWSSVDGLWPRNHAYLYSDASPTLMVDPTGLSTGNIPHPSGQCGCCGELVQHDFTKCTTDPGKYPKYAKCDAKALGATPTTTTLFGFNIALTFVLSLFKPEGNEHVGPCSVTAYEDKTTWLNGVTYQDSPPFPEMWEFTSSAPGFTLCVNSLMSWGWGKCSGGDVCIVYDVPTVPQPSSTDKGFYPRGHHVVQTVNLISSDYGFCGPDLTSTASWTIEFTTSGLDEPDVWTYSI